MFFSPRHYGIQRLVQTTVIFWLGTWSRIVSAAVIQAIFKCPSPFGTFPDPVSCESYWICNNGQSIAATCNFGLIYSHKTKNCDWAARETCTIIKGKVVRDWTTPRPPPLAINGPYVPQSTVDGLPDSMNAVRPMLNANEILAKWKDSQKLSTKFAGVLSTTTVRPYVEPVTGPMNYVLPPGFSKAPRKTYTERPLGGDPLSCSSSTCRLPDCYCEATKVPGGHKIEETPQIIMLTFDDAINRGNSDLLDRLFASNRTNPNGCPITGTFFLTNKDSDYNFVKTWVKKGHEIASHSITHKYFSRYSEKQWKGEIVGEAELAEKYGGVNISSIVGMRAPFLDIGGNTMFRMLWDNGFLYDSSIPSAQVNPPLWPYTLDTPRQQNCFGNCPTGYFPGLWEVPMTDMIGLNDVACSMYDACTFPGNTEEITDMFWTNFIKHYSTNRAPFLLSAHPAWYFNNENRVHAMLKFMEKALKLGDVWFVTVKQAIEWIQHPTPVAKLGQFAPWACTSSRGTGRAKSGNSTAGTSKSRSKSRRQRTKPIGLATTRGPP